MQYNDLTIEDFDGRKTDLGKTVAELLREYAPRHCDYSFSDIFASVPVYRPEWAVADGFLVLRYSYSDEYLIYLEPIGINLEPIGINLEPIGINLEPIGLGDYLPLLTSFEAEAEQSGKKLLLWGIQASHEERLRTAFPHWGFAHNRRYDDYIYLAAELRELNGKKYQPKRNHIHKFTSLYTYEYVPLGTEKSFQDCLELTDEWILRKELHGEGMPESEMENVLSDEREIIRFSLEHFNRLHLMGGAIYVEGKMVAFSFGCALKDDTFCTMIEKADTAFEGAFSMMNYEFARHLPEQFVYIDREWDGGIPGLRQAKLSYHPACFSSEVMGRRLSSKELEVRRLWLECFPEDTAGDVDQFLLNWSQHALLFSHEENGELAAMLFLVPFGDTAYMFAVATATKFRHRGLCRRLIGQAVEFCRQRNFSGIAVIPADEPLGQMYRKFGFSGCHPVRFVTPDDYCFGTGNEADDLAMILPVCSDGNGLSDGKALADDAPITLSCPWLPTFFV